MNAARVLVVAVVCAVALVVASVDAAAVPRTPKRNPIMSVKEVIAETHRRLTERHEL